MGSKLTIGKVARLAAVNIQTVRYYERIGLVKSDACRDSGYRLYTGEAAQRIKIESLRKMAKVLEGLIRSCRSRALTDPCPILSSLEGGENEERVTGGQR